MRLLTLLTLALLGPLVRADIFFAKYSITGTVDSSNIVGINPGDPISGTLETFDNCTLCRFGNSDFDFNIKGFGTTFTPASADFPYILTFNTVTLSLYNYVESDGPFVFIDGNSISYRPTYQDHEHLATGGFSVVLTPEPDTIMLLLTVIGALGLAARTAMRQHADR